MSYATGSYTDQDTALDDFYAWAGNTLGGATNAFPWTQNYTGARGSRVRAHIEKTIGANTFFFNFTSAVAEFNIAGNYIERGIVLQGATGYINDAGATAWDAQTGFTTSTYGGTTTRGGNVENIKAGGGTYHFFATATNLSAVFETDSDENDWRMFTIGALGEYSFYISSGGIAQDDAYRSAYATRFNASPASTRNGSAAVYVPTGGWYLNVPKSGGYIYPRVVGSLLDRVNIDDAPVRGSTANAIVQATPDSFRGNAQLAPSLLNITKGVVGEYWPVGEIEGVKFINMNNYTNEEEVTYDTDTYKLFRIHNPYKPGVAFLK